MRCFVSYLWLTSVFLCLAIVLPFCFHIIIIITIKQSFLELHIYIITIRTNNIGKYFTNNKKKTIREERKINKRNKDNIHNNNEIKKKIQIYRYNDKLCSLWRPVIAWWGSNLLYSCNPSIPYTIYIIIIGINCLWILDECTCIHCILHSQKVPRRA